MARPTGSAVQRARYTAEIVETPQPMGPEEAMPPAGRRDGVAQWAGPPQGFDDAGPGVPYGGSACQTCGDGGPCGDECGRVCDFIECRSRLWFRGEYLMWWIKSGELPPLVTTSPAGTAQAEAGVLGQTGTTILFGGATAPTGTHPGARFTVGFTPEFSDGGGLEASYMFLGDKALRFSQTANNGNPILARPFFNVETALQDSVLIAYPNVARSSRIDVTLANEIQSFDLVSRQVILEEPGRQVDVLLGYRYARFAERLSVDQTFTSGPDNPDLQEGTILQAADTFATSNDFNGFMLGITGQRRFYRWSFEGLAKLALGSTRSRVTINGTTTTTVPNQDPVTAQGALLAQPTNIGRYSHDTFSAIPELGLTVGFDLTRRMRLTFGYSLLYWSQVARPADQIDAGKVAGSSLTHVNVNPSQFSGATLTGMPSPQFRFVTTDLWLQGLNFGLDCRF